MADERALAATAHWRIELRSHVVQSSKSLVVSTVILFHCSGSVLAQDFPVRIAARVETPRPNATVQVLLERDGSGRWQQYLTSASVATNGSFEIPVQRAGLYWLVASEETDWSYRRGACLIEIGTAGGYTWKAVPNTKTGRKWGGRQATAPCQRGVIPFTIYHSKRSSRRSP